jgi:hypothetical protein
MKLITLGGIMFKKSWSWIIATGMVTLLASFTSNGQINERFAAAQQDNARALRQYEWKSRTEILKGGDSKKTQVMAMRYDATGQLQKTIISSTPEPDLPSFGLRGHSAQKKKKEFLEKVEQLSALAKAYSSLPPDAMQRFVTTATFTPDERNLIRIEGHNVVQTGDAMAIFVDGVSRKQRRIEIRSYLEDKPITIVSEFKDLSANGPTYVSNSRVSYDGNSIVLITENFDYVRRQQ